MGPGKLSLNCHSVWMIAFVFTIFLAVARKTCHGYDHTRLSSAAKEYQLKESKFLVVTDTLQAFLEGRGLQNKALAWKQDCKPECYQNNGTCNLLSGTCECPIGRVHSNAGWFLSHPACSVQQHH
jgi:hypothetical protein